MKIMKNLIKFSVLLIVILLALTACNAKESEPEKLTYGAELFDPGIYSTDEFVTGYAGNTDGQVYLIIDRPSGIEDDYDPHNYVYRIGEDGMLKEVVAGDSYLEDGSEGTAIRLKKIFGGEKGSVWISGRAIGLSAHDFLWHIDKNGEELDRIDLTEPETEVSIDRIENAFMDDKKWLYIVSGDKIYVFNHWQKHQFTLDTLKTENGVQAVRLGNGQMGFLTDGSSEVRTIDKTAQGWGESYKLPENGKTIYPGEGEYLFFCNADGNLYGWNTEKNAPEVLLNWLETGINAVSVFGFSIQEDGKMILGIQENNAVRIGVLTPGAEAVEKTVLTLASISGRWERLAAEFNRTSRTCRIVCKTYYTQTGAWPSWDEYFQGRKRLMTEIAAGDIPDLLDAEDLPFQQYGAMGCFEDLWPYIENDPDLGREGVMEHVLECDEQDGKLYRIFGTFMMGSLVGRKDAVGNRTGWTLEDLQTALAAMPEGCTVLWPETAKTEVLRTMLSTDLNHYIDWETGTCSFDSEEFKAALAFCDAACAETGDPGAQYTAYALADEPWLINTLLPEKRMMLLENGISNFLKIQKHEALFGGEVSYIGYPRSDGGCGSSFRIWDALSMTTACKDKDGAWEFMRQILLSDPLDRGPLGFYNSSFPVSRKAFEELREISMTPDYDKDGKEIPKGAEGGYGKNADETLYYYAATQAHYEQAMELYEAIDTVYSDDSDLWGIIGEQALPYFAGDKSLDETAELIQGRAELYVNERM